MTLNAMTGAREKLHAILKKHVPEQAVDYCLSLWINHPFHFKVTKKRHSKLGDYKYNPVYRDHTITVNFNLNAYAFLITYIHELAHLQVTEDFGRNVKPHGRQWKTTFQKLMQPMLNELVFPENILADLRIHMSNPKASTQSDQRLVAALRTYDHPVNGMVCLRDLEEGSVFTYHGHKYRKIKIRRTRILCQHTNSGRKYLISGIALVAPHS
jgi:hypothetical protein